LHLSLLLSLRISRTAGFGAPTTWSTFENVPVMQQAIQHGGNSGAVAEQFAPVFYGSVGGQQCARAFVAAHDDLQQFLGRGQRQLAHSEVILLATSSPRPSSPQDPLIGSADGHRFALQ
jgi:hypothetical protein